MLRAPHPKAPGLEVGITETMIQALVRAFYMKVRRDEVLGPIFNAQIENWEAHLDKLCAFWSSVVLMTGRYKGRPMPVHAGIPDVSEAHFLRWLGLFRETAQSTCPPPAAALFIDRAERIAESLLLGIRLHRGEIVPTRLRQIADGRSAHGQARDGNQRSGGARC